MRGIPWAGGPSLTQHARVCGITTTFPDQGSTYQDKVNVLGGSVSCGEALSIDRTAETEPLGKVPGHPRLAVRLRASGFVGPLSEPDVNPSWRRVHTAPAAVTRLGVSERASYSYRRAEGRALVPVRYEPRSAGALRALALAGCGQHKATSADELAARSGCQARAGRLIRMLAVPHLQLACLGRAVWVFAGLYALRLSRAERSLRALALAGWC